MPPSRSIASGQLPAATGGTSRPSTSYSQPSSLNSQRRGLCSQPKSAFLSSQSRPPTSASYLTTGRGSRATSYFGASESSQIVCAVAEARGVSPTVGIAYVNISTGEAVLSQIRDTQFYIKTATKLQVIEPSRVLIVSTACPPNPKSTLYNVIEEQLPGVRLVALDKKYWHETAGLDFVKALAFREDVEAIQVAIRGNFYATCSFSAVGKFKSRPGYHLKN